MFSRRSAFEREPHPLALAVADARSAGRPLIDLTESNPSRAGFPAPASVLAALADARGARYEPLPFGLPEARAAVARELSREGDRVDPGDLVLVSSTSEAYSLAFRLLCDPGERLLVGRPSYPLLEHLARADGVELDPYRIAHDGAWHFDLADLRARAAATPSARGIVCVHPNNPTGSFVSRAEGHALAALQLPLISDEVFAAYRLESSAKPLSSLRELVAPRQGGAGSPLVIALGGLSKYAALPQLKLAWMIVTGPEAPEALARLEILADAYLSLATPVQLALGEIFAAAGPVRAAICARLERNRAALRDALAGTPASALPTDGGWSVVVRLPATRSDDEWARALLDEHGTIVHPGWLFDFEGGPFVVASLIVTEATFDEGARALASVAAGAD